MLKRVNWKIAAPSFAFVLFVIGLLTFLIFQQNLLTAPPPPVPSLPQPPVILPPPPPCTTPGAPPPPIITASMQLCGTISMAAPSVIAANNILVTCAPGTTINYAVPPTSPAEVIGLHDALQIAPGVTGSQITNCIIQGGFANAIKVGPGDTNVLIQGNTINNAITGIKEDFNANNNFYISNTITGSSTAMKLEGSQGNVLSSTISQNSQGIVTGVDPATLVAGMPNTICSSNPFTPTTCSIIQSGKQYLVQNNNINNNAKGLVMYALDDSIIGNTVTNNMVVGIEGNGIYVGTEINPIWSQQQYYYNLGATIQGNTITNNPFNGIVLNGQTLYWTYTSPAYRRSTIINYNTISFNGQPGQGSGVVIGSNVYTLFPSGNLPYWGEYTKLENNQIKNNLKHGVFLQRGNSMTDVLYNEISNNGGEGISVGSNLMSTGQQYGADYSNNRFIYHNKINQNTQVGIYAHYSSANLIILNEINSNKKGIYVSSSPGAYTSPQFVSEVICNDISSNLQSGFEYDANPVTAPYPDYTKIWEFNFNRIMSNGLDGIRIKYDSNPLAPLLTNLYLPSRIMNNHIASNGGYGVNVDGAAQIGFIANNLVNNVAGETIANGAKSVEIMFDEQQHAKQYNKLKCKYWTACNADNDCGYPGTCVNYVCQSPAAGLNCNANEGSCNCYENPNLLPWVFQYPHTFNGQTGSYSMRGNYFVGTIPNPQNPNPQTIVPPSNAPPLLPTTCAFNQDCTTGSCEFLPAPINNMQCGNINTIYEQYLFGNYYGANGVPFDCPYAYYYPPFFGEFPNNPEDPPVIVPQTTRPQLRDIIPKEYQEYFNIDEIERDRDNIGLQKEKQFSIKLSKK